MRQIISCLCKYALICLKKCILTEVIITEGPYAAFGGRDASRGLATFQVSAKGDEYDDLSDLNSFEMESVKEWEMQFKGNNLILPN